VPGYTGFIPGIQAENVFSITYAKASAKSLANRITRGANLPPLKLYQSVNRSEFNEKNFKGSLRTPRPI
jgi:hypothetical protein